VAHLWLAPHAIGVVFGVEFAGHPSNEAAVLYSNLNESIDSDFSYFENIHISRHLALQLQV
jgi:hypothetical protein